MTETPDAHRLVEALRHPLRRAILRTMYGRGKQSPREIADDLEVSLANVSYHVRVLADYHAIELVETQPVRGSLQHFYRMTIDESWALSVLEIPE